MTLGTVRGSDRIAILAALDPASRTAGTVNTGWVPVAGFDSLLAIVQSGALGSSATVDAKIQQAKDANGTGVKDVTGKSLAQWTQAGTDKSNKQAMINVRVGDLDVANSFTHVRLSVVTATAASLSAGVILGVGNRRKKASASNSAAVDQTV